MSIIYVLIPLALVLAGLAFAAFLWAVRRGQLDDLDSPPYRALFDDDETPPTDKDAPSDDRNPA